jgi:large subunit ribosomal protein L14
MLQHKTVLKVADNTGAHEMYIVHIFGGSKRKYAGIGDIVNAIVKTRDAESALKDGERVMAVIIRTVRNFRRKDGSYIRFDDNAGVIIDTKIDKNPRGTRIFGPVARELKDIGFSKIISMAEEVL